MYIWIVSHYAIPPHESGFTRHFELARALGRLGVRATIITGSSNYQSGALRMAANGPACEQHDFEGVSYLWLNAPTTNKKPLTRLRAMLRFAGYILRGTPARVLPRPDAIIGSSPDLFSAAAACAYARRARIPFLLEIRDLWPDSLIELTGYRESHPLVRVLRWLEGYAYRRANHIITLLEHAAVHFIARGAKAENITCLPNGVTAAEPAPAPAAHSAQFTVLYAGAHGIANYLDTLLEAAVLLANEPVRLRLVGDGVCKPALVAQAKARGLHNVVFEAPVPKTAMPALLAEADACYLQFRDLPLYRLGVSPNKLYDYMLAAKPVLYAANVGSNPVDKSDAGIVLPVGDARALADAIRRLSALPPAERAAMGAHGRAYVLEHHSFDRLAIRLAALLRGLVAEQRQ